MEATSSVVIDTATAAVLCLHSTDRTRGWPAPALEDVAGQTLTFDEGISLDAKVDAAAATVESFGAPMHILASGDDGAVAVRLAVIRPDLVKSLLLADCNPVTPQADVTDDLPRVLAPALVVCAAPDGNTGLEASQTLAGQIDNGVFVVIDHVERPAHSSRPSSFSAWTSSFISIVEGLRALD